MNKRQVMQEVNKTAWSIIKETKASWGDAIKRAWKQIKQSIKCVMAIASNYFEIEFVKVSTGEITKRTASNARIKGNTLLFFSITDNGFRSAVIDEILTINPIDGVTLKLV
jgi:hypothetical protein